MGDKLAGVRQASAPRARDAGFLQAQEHEQLQVHGDHIDSLKKAHSSMAGNKARRRVVGRNSRCHGMQAKLEEKLEEHHATLSERVNNLEKADASGPLGMWLLTDLSGLAGAGVHRCKGGCCVAVQQIGSLAV